MNIYFCRSCGEREIDDERRSSGFIQRLTNFDLHGPDSVALQHMVNPVMYPSKEDLRKMLKPEAIIKISIRFERRWSQSKYDRIKTQNDTLIAVLERKKQYSAIPSDDFRATIPDSTVWKRYLTEYDFYFERLPYESYLTDKSIIFDADLPGDYNTPFYVDRNDSLYFMNNNNYMGEFYRQSRYQIAYALGLKDYK